MAFHSTTTTWPIWKLPVSKLTTLKLIKSKESFWGSRNSCKRPLPSSIRFSRCGMDLFCQVSNGSTAISFLRSGGPLFKRGKSAGVPFLPAVLHMDSSNLQERSRRWRLVLVMIALFYFKKRTAPSIRSIIPTGKSFCSCMRSLSQSKRLTTRTAANSGLTVPTKCLTNTSCSTAIRSQTLISRGVIANRFSATFCLTSRCPPACWTISKPLKAGPASFSSRPRWSIFSLSKSAQKHAETGRSEIFRMVRRTTVMRSRLCGTAKPPSFASCAAKLWRRTSVFRILPDLTLRCVLVEVMPILLHRSYWSWMRRLKSMPIWYAPK